MASKQSLSPKQSQSSARRDSTTDNDQSSRRASLGAQPISMTCCDSITHPKTNQHRRATENFEKLRLTGSELQVVTSAAEAAVSSEGGSTSTSPKSRQLLLSRTSIGGISSLLGASTSAGSSASSSSVIKPVCSSSTKRSSTTGGVTAKTTGSPLRSLSPASSSFFGFRRSFLSFDSRNDEQQIHQQHQSHQQQHKQAISEASTKVKAAPSSSSVVRARRSIASPLSLPSAIGGLLAGHNKKPYRQSLSSASSVASLSIDSIPDAITLQRRDQDSCRPSRYKDLDEVDVSASSDRVVNPEQHESSQALQRDKDKETDISPTGKSSSVARPSSMASTVTTTLGLSFSSELGQGDELSTNCQGLTREHATSADYIVPLFGCNIETLATVSKGSPLPSVIDSAMRFITDFGLKSVGIFRKSGVRSRIVNLRRRIESNQNLRFQDMDRTEFSIYDVADLVKMWLRELRPTPLLNRELIQNVSRLYDPSFSGGATESTETDATWPDCAPSSSNLSMASDDLAQLIGATTTSSHRAVLVKVLSFFAHVCQHSAVNQMTAQNLAICLTPSLCSTETDPRSILIAQKALELCINHYRIN